MSQYTENYHLEKPESNDNFENFRENYNSNMDIIDQHLGGGGGSSVSWQQLQVTGDKIATIRVSGIPQDVFAPNSQTFTMAISRANINSGETYSTIFGKIKKWFNDLKTVAFSGSYNDLSDQPTIPTATSDLNNDSDFVSDASYVHTDNNFTNADVTKLSGIQSGAEVNVQSDWNEIDSTSDAYIANKPSLATVATSGSYADLSNKPTIPDELADLADDSTHRVVTDTQISTWNGKSDFSGSYNDLTDKPTIPTVNDGTLTIQQNGTTVGTFTANQSGNTTVNLTGGGGSAHTIVNESGTALADEPNLQFTDGLKASDDNVNSKTKVGVNTTFTEAGSRANIASGDSFSTILGKIKKFFSDLKTVAFTGSYDDLSNKPTIPVGSDYVQKSGDTMTGTLNVQTENNVCINLRPGNADWYDTISTQTSGNEAVVFATKKDGTSWIFVNGEDSVTNHASNRWQSLTPALQIKKNCIAIGKLIANASDPTYKCEINGVTYSKGIVVEGRAYNSGDDEGIVIKPSNGWAGVILGSHNAERSCFYFKTGSAFWRYSTGQTNYDISHPKKAGTIALTSDIPTNTNQLTNGAGFITSSGSCASATSFNGLYVKKFTSGSDTSIQIKFKGSVSTGFVKVMGDGNYTAIDFLIPVHSTSLGSAAGQWATNPNPYIATGGSMWAVVITVTAWTTIYVVAPYEFY